MQIDPVAAKGEGAGIPGAPEDESRIAWIVVKVLAYITTILAGVAAIVSLFLSWS